MIPYYSPNISLTKIINSFFIKNKDEVIKEYFKNITGKKYILFTNSGRSALYLSYKALNIKGEVLTSPLTCRSALDPIHYSGNVPVFIDIDKDSLNINIDKLINYKITEHTKAIQIIHHGGLTCDMQKVKEFSMKNNLILIEDCAQSFKSKDGDKYSGNFGDIACFSLIKNAYGIGGGILATNIESVYNKAYSLQNELSKINWKKTFIRTSRALFETYRNNNFINEIYKYLLIRLGKANEGSDSFFKELKRPSNYLFKILYLQLLEWDKLHFIRKQNGSELLKALQNKKLIYNYLTTDVSQSSFTKFFIYNPKFNAKFDIKTLNEMGIEAMHLEHSSNSYFQKRLDKDTVYHKYFNNGKYDNYFEIHNNIISLPLFEKNYNVKSIVEKIEKIIKKNENNLV